ncbi:hypothetical protein CRUP_018000, partial [Coryphaenoides rupestris]
FRLPSTLVPLQYSVTLWPRLTPDPNDLYLFTGNSSVEFECMEETDLIVIHSNKLTYSVLDNNHLGQLSARGMRVTRCIPLTRGRRFPCFDEPAMKAVFHITLIHPRGTTALSNGLETKRMSSYLLALVVCDYANLTAQQGDTLIRIWARRRAIEEGHGDYALRLTDQIALPDFYFGAMENWGLVTYRETNLLYDPLTSSNRNRETTATIIAHELAHMWFGNLVTLRWWNEVWLNEGFASYVAYLGADKAEPSWDVIGEQFDAISYSKAVKRNGVVLPGTVQGIMDRWVLQMGFPVVTIDTTTGDVTQKHFLLSPEAKLTSPYKATAFGLLNAMCKLAAILGSSIFASFVGVTKAVPILLSFAALICGGLVALKLPDTRKKILHYEWLIPVRWMKSRKVQQEPWWLMTNTAVNADMKTTADDWVLANVNVIPVINRAQLVDDAFNLARAGMVPTTLALQTTVYLSAERHYIPWQSALDNMRYYYLMLDRTDVYGPMQDYMRSLVTPLYLHFNATSGWTDVPEAHMDQYNQVNAVRMACSTGLEECRHLTSRLFTQWMDDATNNTSVYMIRKQDATNVITSIASNREGQVLAWDFVRDNWNYMYGVGSFNFAALQNQQDVHQWFTNQTPPKQTPPNHTV